MVLVVAISRIAHCQWCAAAVDDEKGMLMGCLVLVVARSVLAGILLLIKRWGCWRCVRCLYQFILLIIRVIVRPHLTL